MRKDFYNRLKFSDNNKLSNMHINSMILFPVPQSLPTLHTLIIKQQ